MACCRAELPGCCPCQVTRGQPCTGCAQRQRRLCAGSALRYCPRTRCSHPPAALGGELQITREGCIFAPRLFAGYFKVAEVPTEILRRVCSTAGHIESPPVLTLSSCPWLASGGQPPDSVLASRTLGAPEFDVSTLFSSVLTKLQLGFLSRLGGCQGENTKQCRMHSALPAARASCSTASALPYKHCLTPQSPAGNLGW